MLEVALIMLALIGVLTWVFRDAIIDRIAEKLFDEHWLFGPDDKDSH